VEGRGHQNTHKTFNTKFDLPRRYERIKMEQRVRGQPKKKKKKDCPNLRLFPGEKANAWHCQRYFAILAHRSLT
jgi:hypothetical protein